MNLYQELAQIPNILGAPHPHDQFEAELLGTHLCYLVDGRAFVVKLGVPKGFDRGTGHWFPKAKTPFDFAVFLPAGGRYGGFDAKVRKIATEADWKFQWSSVPEHQWLSLALLEEMGGIGFFLVGIDGGAGLDHARIVPAGLGKPGASVDMRKCRKVERGYSPPWDWLSVLGALP